jgi:glycosyltransferase involved in cell wall biosynthesis
VRLAWLGHRSATGADGLITYSRQITAGLRDRGVEVLFLHHSRDFPGEAQADSIALEAVSLSHRLVIARPGVRRRLADLLRRRQVDLVHVSLSFSSLDFNLPRLCHELGLPIVATFHVPFDTRMSVWRGISSAVYRLYAQALAECDAVIIFGDVQREILAGLGVPRDRIHVLPNGVDVNRYRPAPDGRQRDGALGQLSADRVFSYVGRLDPEKNVDVLLGAFLDADPPPDLRLVVVGGGVGRRSLERRFRDPRIVFTGIITDERDRIAILQGSDAFFLPSSVEGLSLAMLEAMACGAATVATDVGSDGEALRGAGIVLDPTHLDAELRAAIRLLVESPNVSALLGELARARAVERFSLSTNLDRLMELYATLVSRKALAG